MSLSVWRNHATYSPIKQHTETCSYELKHIRIKRICTQCGNGFGARTTVTKTCSDVCAKRAYKTHKRATKIGQSDEQVKAIKAKPTNEIRLKETLNIADASRLLGVSRWTIWRAIGAGNLNAVKLGRRTLIRRSDIDRLFEPTIASQRLTPSPTALADCYTMKEVREKYGISEKALYDLIQRNNIPKQHSGIYAYVPKTWIDELLA